MRISDWSSDVCSSDLRGARQLRHLKKGTPLTIKARLDPRPKMAITGNVFLIRDGQRKARDDREMPPRTAIGIDYDTGMIFMLVIDGRPDHSRAYPSVDLATPLEHPGPAGAPTPHGRQDNPRG